MCNCRFCCKDENFAYFVVNDNGKGSRILIRSGGGIPLVILYENRTKNRWHTLGAYMPKFAQNAEENWRYYNET